MGWFDQEAKEKGQEQGTTRTAPPPPKPAQGAGPSRVGSTIGPKVHINGTLIAEEDLEILGKVEGTVHARGGLRVAPEADVKAVINGASVMIEGTVNGDVNATETLILGPSAALTGNIKTPSLQIREGAFFRGQVTMQQAEPQASAPAQSSRPDSKSAEGSGAGKDASSPAKGSSSPGKPRSSEGAAPAKPASPSAPKPQAGGAGG